MDTITKDLADSVLAWKLKTKNLNVNLETHTWHWQKVKVERTGQPSPWCCCCCCCCCCSHHPPTLTFKPQPRYHPLIYTHTVKLGFLLLWKVCVWVSVSVWVSDKTVIPSVADGPRSHGWRRTLYYIEAATGGLSMTLQPDIRVDKNSRVIIEDVMGYTHSKSNCDVCHHGALFIHGCKHCCDDNPALRDHAQAIVAACTLYSSQYGLLAVLVKGSCTSYSLCWE